MKKLISVLIFLNVFSVFSQTIDIDNPIGSTIWVKGEDQIIEWTSDFIEDVTIKLFKSGVEQYSFNSVCPMYVSNEGEYPFTLEGSVYNLEPGGGYRVFISKYNDATFTINDDSDEFTIENPQCVTYPNGGQTLYAGETYTIEYNNLVGQDVDIDLYIYGAWLMDIEELFMQSTCSWTIPSTISTNSNYQIKVTNNSGYPNLFDLSDTYFTIENNVLETPVLSAQVTSGTAILLSWEDVDNEDGYSIYTGSTVDSLTLLTDYPENSTGYLHNYLNPGTYCYKVVAYNNDHSSESNIVCPTIQAEDPPPDPPSYLNVQTVSQSELSLSWENVANEEGYTVFWGSDEQNINNFFKSYSANVTQDTDPDLLPGEQRCYKVIAFNDAGDSSPATKDCETTSSAAEYVAITSPNGGENWEKGTTQTISWSSNIQGNVRVELYLSGEPCFTIEPSWPNNGSYSWTIPLSFSNYSYYSIKITSTSDYNITDQSNYFTISAQPSQDYLYLSIPEGGESWVVDDLGVEHMILWNTNLTGTFTLELYKNNALYEVIVDNEADSFFSWWVIDYPVGNNYQIKVISNSNPTLNDISGNFSLIEPIPDDYIYVTNPEDQEWVVNDLSLSVLMIEWATNITDPVDIDLIRNNALVMNLETEYTGSDGIFGYDFSSLVADDNYRVKISNSNDNSINSASMYFIIAPQPQINVANPTNGESWEVETSQTVEWNWSNNDLNLPVSIYLNKSTWESDEFIDLILSTNDDGIESISVPSGLSLGDDYRIVVAAERGDNICVWGLAGESETFSIVEGTPDSYVNISPHSLSLESTSGSNKNFTIYSNSDWEITDDVGWLTYSDWNDNGDASITVTATENTSTSPRTANVTIAVDGDQETLTVTQQGTIFTANLDVSTNDVTLQSYINSSKTVNIYCNTNWTASESSSWLNCNTSGTGNSSILIKATSANNSTSPRTGYVYVEADTENEVIVVTQNGSNAYIYASPEAITLSWVNGSAADVSISSNTSWSISDNVGWLNYTGYTPSGNDVIHVTTDAINSGANPRTATVTVSGSGESDTFTVTQNSAYPTITSFKINNGNTSTSSQVVTLNNTASNNPTQYIASEDPNFSDASWQTYSTNPQFTLSEEAGQKTVFFKTWNSSGESSAQDQINYSAVFNVLPGFVNLSYDQYSQGTIEINTNTDWEISNIPDWLNVSNESDFGNSTIIISALTENNGYQMRQAYLNVTNSSYNSTTIEVMQDFSTSTNILADYPFSGNPYDMSGNEHHGEAFGAILTEDRLGNSNCAYHFDGTDDYIITNADNFLDASNAGAISFWIYPESSDVSTILTYSTDESTNSYFSIGLVNSKLQIGYKTTGGIIPWITTVDPIVLNQWNYVIISGDGVEMNKIFLNGEEQDVVFNNNGSDATGSEWISYANLIANYDHFLNIGSQRRQNAPYANGFEGNIDDIRIYNCSIDETQATIFFDGTKVVPTPVYYYPFNGNANDESGHQNHGIIYNAMLVDDRNGNEESAYDFDGLENYIYTPANNALDNHLVGTISLWFYTRSSSNQTIFSYRTDDTTSYFNIELSGQKIRLNYRAPDGISPFINGTTTLEMNTWYHLIVVGNGNDRLKVFIDGQEEDTELFTNGSTSQGKEWIGLINNISTYNHYINIGSFKHEQGIQSLYFDGKIDDIEIYGSALSESEIGEYYYSIDEESVVDNEIRIYPNPNNGAFYIEFNNAPHIKANIILFDIFGKEIMDRKIDSTKLRYYINEKIRKGIYLLQVITEGEKYINKIVIN